MACLILPLAMAAIQLAALEGYVFRETGGGPPRRPVTIELLQEGRSKYHEMTDSGGAFQFAEVREGNYTVRARYADFVIVEDVVTVTEGKNFAAVMMPKRRAGAQQFGTVTVDQLAARGNRDLQKKLRRAAELAAKRDLVAAAKLYEEAAASGAFADVWDALALLYLHLDRRDEAFRAFEKAIELDPRFLLSYLHLGTLYLEERRYKELAEVATQALAIDPTWLTGHLFLGEAQAAKRELAAAQQSAETASELAHGKAAAPYLLLAKIRWSRGDCAGALRHLQRYLELNTSARGLPQTAKSLEMLQSCRLGL